MNDFIQQWVAPYYLYILHGNYSYSLKGDEQTAFNNNVKKALESVNDDVVNQLLAGGWRERLTGSWFCGLKGWSQFTDKLGVELVESERTYAGQGYSFALACFASNKSVIYLKQYLDIYLPQKQLIYDQGWVMPALMWIDEQKNTNYCGPYLIPGGLWEKFVADKATDSWKLDNRKEQFWSLMNYCQENFAKPKAG